VSIKLKSILGHKSIHIQLRGLMCIHMVVCVGYIFIYYVHTHTHSLSAALAKSKAQNKWSPSGAAPAKMYKRECFPEAKRRDREIYTAFLKGLLACVCIYYQSH
jgi:hypothetical protein